MASSVGMGYRTLKVKSLSSGDLEMRVGFKPRKVVVHNLTNNYRAEWNESMAEGHALVTSDAGARSNATSNGFSLLAGSSTQPPGVKLGSLANLNDTADEDLLVEVYGGFVEQA